MKQIADTLSKSKTTIYYYFRKIKGRTVETVVPNCENEEILGEFIGLFAGDGCTYLTKDYKYRTYLYFNITEKEYVENLIDNVLLKLFKKKPMIFIQENRLNLCYYSKAIYELVHHHLNWNKKTRKTYSVRLRDGEYSSEFIIGFIRGSLDSDGHFSKKRINFASVSRGLIENISSSLARIDIPNSVTEYAEKRANRRNIYHINVPRKQHSRFINIVSPRNKVKYEGLNAPAGIRISECSTP